MSTPAQITICGALGKDAIAQLVEIALTAGAGLVVQPRAIAAMSADIVEASPRPRALPPASPAIRKAVARALKPKGGDRRDVSGKRARAVDDDLEARVRRVLQRGPMPAGAFRREVGLSPHQARQLKAAGVIVATGAGRGAKCALPGHSAKEAP